MGDLTENFSRSEFACKCGCGFEDIQMKLVERLQAVRKIIGPIQILSGCRCQKHNREVGGKPSSAHLHGAAADIFCPGNRLRYRLVSSLLREGRFNRLGLGKSFIHADVDPEKTPARIWLYT